MILASKNIKNISNIETEIGSIDFLVPDLVIEELGTISHTSNYNKKKDLQRQML
jgi:rRNA-processing protein FCF1